MRKIIFKRLQTCVLGMGLVLSSLSVKVNAQQDMERELFYGEVLYEDDKQVLAGLSGQSQYTNTAYTSTIVDGKGYYESQLSSQAAIIYDLIEENIELTKDGTAQISKDIKGKVISVDDIRNGAYQYAIDAYRADHPDKFWLDYTKMAISYSYFNDGYIANLKLKPGSGLADYYMDASEDNNTYFGGEDPFTSKAKVDEAVQKAEKKAEECIALIPDNATDYDKIKVIHDWLVENVEYSLDHYDQSIYAALVQGKAVCAGYVTAFEYIAEKVGINSLQVCGLAHADDSKSEGHAWNLVELDDIWYALDITWDDPINGGDKIRTDFFLVGLDTVTDATGGKTFAQSHEMHNYFSVSAYTFLLPTVSNVAFVYTESNGNDTDDNGDNNDSDNEQDLPVLSEEWDVNCDGKKNLLDAKYVLGAVLKVRELTFAENVLADINEDKRVDLMDVQYMLKCALGIR